MVGKSRHYRDESDPLLGYYSQTLAATSSVRNQSNPLYNHDGNYNYNNKNNSSQKYNYESAPLKDEGTNTPLMVSPNSKNNSPLRNSITSSLRLFQRSPSQDDLMQRKGKYRVHRVSYTAGNHIQVLFRMYGSAMPSVLPFCIGNVLWMFSVAYLKEHDYADLTFHSSVGHSFMGLLVSFLIVSRSKISYDRFMEHRRHLATCYRCCRELVQLACVYTQFMVGEGAQQWRQEVSYRTILLLRVTMDALLWSSTERQQWEHEYYRLDDIEQELDTVSDHFFRVRKLSHGRRSNIDEHFRAPITFSHLLKQVIMTHPLPSALGEKLAVNEYRDLLNFTTLFIEAFHGFRVLIFTPYPFPLVQMTRAFLLFWVYTLPLVLLKEYRLWSSLLIVLLVTFGFVGIEYVSMALDDPFGDDTNDVDEHGMALLVYEDIYLAIYRTDGPEAALALRDRVLQRYKQGRGLDCHRQDLKGYDIWEPLHYYHLRKSTNTNTTTKTKVHQDTSDSHDDHSNNSHNDFDVEAAFDNSTLPPKVPIKDKSKNNKNNKSSSKIKMKKLQRVAGSDKNV